VLSASPRKTSARKRLSGRPASTPASQANKASRSFAQLSGLLSGIRISPGINEWGFRRRTKTCCQQWTREKTLESGNFLVFRNEERSSL
jgi:hypothetical protein